ncbi:MAG TPA: hypothetical protein VGP11_06165 [Acidimicrobiales bacterium]|jgi:hypothetical protein|nr:hypothetical protein [Acidimicrobiales bacterium]
MVTRIVPRTRRDRLLATLLIGASLEIVWAVYLGWRLPRHYVADHWALAWVGLDVAEIVMLFGAAWAAWRQRAVLIVFSIAAATLFLLDAWFDVTTANHGDELQSVVLAVFIEVPSALLLLWVARRAAVRLIATHAPNSPLASMSVRKVLLIEGEDSELTDAPTDER